MRLPTTEDGFSVSFYLTYFSTSVTVINALFYLRRLSCAVTENVLAVMFISPVAGKTAQSPGKARAAESPKKR